MLRRYLIANGLMTMLLYGAIWAFVPSAPHLLHSAWESLDAFAMESPILGPVMHRIITVTGRR